MSDQSILEHPPFLRFPRPMPPDPSQSEAHQPMAVEVECTLFFDLLDESDFTIVIELREGLGQ
jgi:hypothetical protein